MQSKVMKRRHEKMKQVEVAVTAAKQINRRDCVIMERAKEKVRYM